MRNWWRLSPPAVSSDESSEHPERSAKDEEKSGETGEERAPLGNLESEI